MRYNGDMHTNHLVLLRLMQLSDSALPVGAAAHSFGLETLVDEGILGIAELEVFLQDYLEEVGTVESVFCRLGHRLARESDQALFVEQWLALNRHVSARKMARESRAASAILGRRLLQVLNNLAETPAVSLAVQSAQAAAAETHYSPAFGLAGGIIGADETATTLACLQQAFTGLVSACQRLMPLGQSQASRLIWEIKPALIAIAERSEEGAANLDELSMCTPLIELGSMRHPCLATRLFIS